MGKKSNYMSLLNLPKQMNLFGPLRRYWEGSYRGEALVQELKPLIKTGLTTNWQERTMNRYYNQRALDQFQKDVSDNYEQHHYDRGKYHYGSIESIMKQYRNHQPLSVCEINNCYYAIFVNKEKYYQIIKGKYHSSLLKMSYFGWSLNISVEMNINSNDKITRSCLLLPLLRSNNADDQREYACIDSKWNELGRNGFCVPDGVNEHDLVGW